MGVIYTLRFFPIQRIKREKRDFRAPKKGRMGAFEEGLHIQLFFWGPKLSENQGVQSPPYGAGFTYTSSWSITRNNSD